MLNTTHTSADGGTRADAIAPPPDGFFFRDQRQLGCHLLTYGTAHVLLAGGAEAREEEYMASGLHEALNSYQGSQTQNLLT